MVDAENDILSIFKQKKVFYHFLFSVKMKSLITIGLPIDKPYLYVVNNSLHGTYADYHRALNYFLYSKFNVNLVDCGPIGYDICFENGSCSGSLGFIQSGKANFFDKVSAGQLQSLPDNLTIGPIIKEDYCHLYNKPSIQLNSRSQDFLDFDERLNWSVILVFLLFCATFLCLILLTNRIVLTSKHLNIWNLYEVALGRRYLPMIKEYVIIGLTFSWFGFFFILIVTSTFQTGLIKSISFLKVEQPNDILIHSLIPTTFNHRFCRYKIEKSTIPIYQKICSKLVILDRKKPNNTLFRSYQLMDNDNRVFIAEEYFEVLYKGFRCKFKDLVGEQKKTFYKSNTSFDHLLFFFVLSSSTAPKITRIARKYALQAFETSNLQNHFLWELITKVVETDKYFSPCAQDQNRNRKIQLTSLSIRHFSRPVLILMRGSIIIVIIFLGEITFHRLKMLNFF